MTESKQHQYLVTRLVRAITDALGDRPRSVCRIDGKHSRGVAPTVIDGHRPDVFVFNRTTTVVGEAKPPDDLETERSRRQLQAFVRYVEADPSRHLVLSVHWSTAVTAKLLLRTATQERHIAESRLHVLDGVRALVLSQGEEAKAEHA